MADYSKEYVEKYLNGFPHDFSIVEEFENIEDGYYINCICEGYGFIGISKENGICKLIFDIDGEDEYKLIPFEELNDFYEDIFLNKL